MFKILALLFMTLDHIGLYFEPQMPFAVFLGLRLIGRLAFPMFVYSVVMGMYKTHSIPHYLLRLITFAVTCELGLLLTAALGFPYEIQPNVIFTLAAGLSLIYGWELISTQKSSGICGGITLILLAVSGIALLKPDYDFYGLGLFVIMYMATRQRTKSFAPTEQPQPVCIEQAGVIAERYQTKLSMQTIRPVSEQRRNLLISLFIYGLIFLSLQIIFTGGLPEEPWPYMQAVMPLSVFFIPLYASDGRPSRAFRLFYYLFFPLHHIILFSLTQLCGN